MTEESMADRLAQDMRPDREVQLEQMRRRLTELGDLDGLARLDATMLEWAESEWQGRYGDPVEGIVQHLATEVMAATAELTGRPGRLAAIRVVTSLQEDVSARLRPLPDGSALISVSDATSTLCNVYGGYAADAFHAFSSGGLKTLWRIAKAHSRGSIGEDPALLAGLLRYYFVNQRVFALAAKLQHRLSPEAEGIGGLLLVQAMSFVLGHEVAHHALEHSLAPSGFSPEENLSACTDSEQLELDADLLAYRATIRAAERQIAEIPQAAALASFSEIGAALGALIGMLAVHATEQALFIRRGRSHPPAPARAARLLSRFTPQIQTFAKLFLADLLAATREAADFSESGRPFDWEGIARSPKVSSSQPDDYLRTIATLDALQCRPRQDLADSMAQISPELPVGLAEATRAALAGDARTALLGWGVSAAKTEAFCDPHRALTFSSLVDAIRGSFKTQSLRPDARLSAAVAAAQLLSQPLAGR